MGHLARIIQLLFLHILIANLLDIACADPPYKLCSNTSGYGANSPFQNNLMTLLASLSSNASVSKQYNSSAGNGTDRVYGQYMCLNYLSDRTCSNCIAIASESITQLCGNDKEAVVWEENCQLRYSNQNFLGHLDVSGNQPYDNEKNISNPEKFRSFVNATLSGLVRKAAFNSSVNMSVTGEAAFTDTDTLYALVQCSTDLSPEDCNTCLHAAMENVSCCYYFSRGARLLSRSCYLRYELYAFYEGATGPDQEMGKSNPSRIGTIIAVVTITAAVLLLALLGSFVYYFNAKIRTQRRNNEIARQEVQLHSIGDPKSLGFLGRDGLSAQESAFMDLASLHAATNNFSESNLLGRGGFGPVYKGVLSDGTEVAVKRLASYSEQGIEEFTNEVLLIMKLQHKNLVRLLGFCVYGEEKLLVYELMPNSSLDVILFDPTKRAQLNWSRRINIINGIAKGILYLHEDSRLRIVHRDLKASNVLLDNDMNPKISDFGMARIFAGSEGEANTARIVGTYGYMAPEYAMEGLYSTKSDVFSFGVLLLEIITGLKNAGFHKSKHAPSLSAYAWRLFNEGKELELMDPLVEQTCNPDEFSQYMHIGLLCVQEDACDRPTMLSVVLMLKSETVALPEPQRPAFSVGRFTEHHEAEANNLSANCLTLSSVAPR